jgi:formamidopyrimidine-DNA glycosylase
MPELPEVETIKNQIAPHLPVKVEKVEYSDVSSSIIKDKEFNPMGKMLLKIERQGKVLLLIFENEQITISGLGMSGGWRVSPTKVLEKHTHFQIMSIKENGEKVFLAYVDPRRFGNLHFFKKPSADKWLTRLGADVSKDEFTPEYIFERCQKHPGKVIKAFLLEQNHFAGVGNYMASEICAHARILPDRLNKNITKKDALKLWEATALVLKGTVDSGGTTFSGGYKDTSGSQGEGVKSLVVFYQEVCRMCGRTKVLKTILKGRGTYHCPRCQK